MWHVTFFHKDSIDGILDYKMREINSRDPDLILIGSQSGTIPYDILEHSTHSVTSFPFLLGTKPDAEP